MGVCCGRAKIKEPVFREEIQKNKKLKKKPKELLYQPEQADMPFLSASSNFLQKLNILTFKVQRKRLYLESGTKNMFIKGQRAFELHLDKKNQKIYKIGGWVVRGGKKTQLSVVDLKTGLISKKKPKYPTRHCFGSIFYQNFLYIAGGRNEEGYLMKDFDKIDPITGKPEKLPQMPMHVEVVFIFVNFISKDF